MATSYWQRGVTRRRVLGGATLGAAAIALAACGGNSTNNSSGSTNAAATSAATSAGAPKSAATSGAAGTPRAAGSPAAAALNPKTGGTIRTYQLAAPENPGLDTYLNYSATNCNYSSFIYAKLTKLKVVGIPSPNDFVVDLDLATAFEQPDPQTYTFHINPKAKWQDVAPLNGRALTADDIVWNFQLWNQKGQNRILTGPVTDSITAVDANTVQFKLKQPVAAFPIYVGHTGGPFIMPRELKENDQTRDKTAASGAWILDHIDAGTSVVFKRNPNYYNAPKPYADGVTCSVILDPSTLSANIRTGALDVALFNEAPSSDAANLKNSLPGSTWQIAEFMNIGGWAVDIGDTKFGMKDERVRQAISLSVDRDGMYKFLGDANGEAYKTPFPPYGPWWVDPKKDAQMSPYFLRNPQKAKQLLAAAGFPNGLQGVPYITNTDLANSGDYAALHQSALKDAGINVQIQSMPTAQYFKCCFFGDTGSSIIDGVGIFNTDPDEGLSLVLDPTSSRSPVPNKALMAQDSTLLDLMSKIKGELDRNKRIGYCADIQRYLAQKMYFIGNISQKRYYFASKRLKNMGWVVHYAYGPIVADTWIDES